MALQIRRGLEADRVTFAPAQGELLYTTDDKKLYIGDGTTPGGNAVGGGDLVTEITASQFVHNQHSNITFTYDVGSGRIIGNIPNFNIKIAADDSVVRTVNLGETIQFSGLGGTAVTSDAEGNINISTLYSIEAVTAVGGASLRLSDGLILDDVTFVGSGSTTVVRTDANTITISSSGGGGGASNSFETIAVAGQSNVVADNGTDLLTFVAGTGIDIITDGILDTITFSSNINSFSTITGYDTTLNSPVAITANSYNDSLFLVPGAGINMNVDPFSNSIIISSVPTETYLSIDDLFDVDVTFTGIGPGETLVWNGLNAFENQQLVEPSNINEVAFYTANQRIGGDPSLTFDNSTGTLSTIKVNVHSLNNNEATGLTIINTANPYVIFGGTLNSIEYSGKIFQIDKSYTPGAYDNVFITIHDLDADINPQLGVFRARGTIASPQKVLTNDTLGAILFSGHNGVASRPVAKIQVNCETGPIQGQSNVPGSMSIQLTNNDNILNTALTINSNARVDLTGELFVAKQISNNTIRINNNVIETIVSNANLELRTSGSGAIYLDNISINTGIIDTLDSSAIVIEPSVFFMSDANVQNNLTVTNKVYAEEFVSTSNVTPEISAATQLAIKVGNKEWDVNANGTLQYPILSSAPSGPANGMMAIADGIGWDPLSLPNKQQMVVYLGGGWRQVAVEP